MTDKIQSIKGMSDILPQSSELWQHVEKKILNIFGRYGYHEIRLPIVEKTELFKRSIGELTDIVSKEMYTFTDRDGDNLTLRPEATAGTVRAGLQHNLFQNNIQRLWYMGPMFRRERPQKGRSRQFHQIGAEVFGLEGPDIDAEIIIMSARLWKELGISDLDLQINTLGTITSRQLYREVLVEYFSDNIDRLDEDSRKRLDRNPLRILDSKNPEMSSLINSAPDMKDYLDSESEDHFADLQKYLNAVNVNFEVNPKLVRGLDYYTKTVFEWVTSKLGAQGAVCAGGRYDGLVEHFGGKPTPGVGFALGLERLVELFAESNPGGITRPPDIYFIAAGDTVIAKALQLAEDIRENSPFRVLVNCGGGSFKSQFKKADKSGASLALILGDTELEKETIGIKHLRQESTQTEVPWDQLIMRLEQELRL